MLWQNGLNMVQFLWSSLWEKMRRKKKDGLIFKTTHDKHDFGLRSLLYGVTKWCLPQYSYHDIYMYVWICIGENKFNNYMNWTYEYYMRLEIRLEYHLILTPITLWWIRFNLIYKLTSKDFKKDISPFQFGIVLQYLVI